MVFICCQSVCLSVPPLNRVPPFLTVRNLTTNHCALVFDNSCNLGCTRQPRRRAFYFESASGWGVFSLLQRSWCLWQKKACALRGCRARAALSVNNESAPRTWHCPDKLMSPHVTQLLWERNMEDFSKVSPYSHSSASVSFDTLVKWSGSPGRALELIRRFSAWNKDRDLQWFHSWFNYGCAWFGVQLQRQLDSCGVRGWDCPPGLPGGDLIGAHGHSGGRRGGWERAGHHGFHCG